jgi:hypothetical protein
VAAPGIKEELPNHSTGTFRCLELEHLKATTIKTLFTFGLRQVGSPLKGVAIAGDGSFEEVDEEEKWVSKGREHLNAMVVAQALEKGRHSDETLVAAPGCKT